MAKKLNNLKIENAQIMFRNFSGREGKYNPAGRKNFCLRLNAEVADALCIDGWNVKQLNPRDPDDDPVPYIQVTVEYKNFPPNVKLVSNGTMTDLTDETVGCIDFAEIDNVDLVIRPYEWEMNGKTGIKAYLKTMYVTIADDEFGDKYVDIPKSAIGVSVPEENEELPFE